MWKIVVALLVILALYVGNRPELLPRHALPVQEGALRQGTKPAGGVCPSERCLLVYVAPWCPSCRRAEPMLAELRASLLRDGVGIEVVVGMDEPPELEAHARTFGYPVLLDMDGAVKRDAGIRGVPYFIVTDRRGQVIKRQAGAFGDVETNRRQLGV